MFPEDEGGLDEEEEDEEGLEDDGEGELEVTGESQVRAARLKRRGGAGGMPEGGVGWSGMLWATGEVQVGRAGGDAAPAHVGSNLYVKGWRPCPLADCISDSIKSVSFSSAADCPRTIPTALHISCACRDTKRMQTCEQNAAASRQESVHGGS